MRRFYNQHELPIRAFLLAVVMLTLQACGTTSAIAVAETPAQKAYAISSTYNIILEAARDIVTNEGLSLSVRRAVQNAEAQTTPIVNSLEQAYTDYIIVKAELNLGLSTQDKLTIAADNLADWIIKAERALVDLVAAIG